MDDNGWLEQAIDLARENVARGGRPFAALIVRDDEVVATAVKTSLVDLDPTAHAELIAIRAACQALGSLSLSGCLLVASGQPCPMCQAAAIYADIERTIFAADLAVTTIGGFDSSPVAAELARPFSERAAPIAHVPTAAAVAPFKDWRDRAS